MKRGRVYCWTTRQINLSPFCVLLFKSLGVTFLDVDAPHTYKPVRSAIDGADGGY